MILGIIPARIASTRLPGKMLLDIGGEPLLWHTWNHARLATRIDRLVIAAGDDQIASAARSWGAEVVEVFEDVQSGSDRVWRAYQLTARRIAEYAGDDIVLNIQGDEPQIDPGTIDATIGTLLSDKDAGVGTAVTPITVESDYLSPTVVKVVLDAQSRALYFSRSPIPHYVSSRASDGTPRSYRHMGLYAYRAWALERFAALPPSALENAERLEQLRLLEDGVRFAVAIVESAGQEVNTEEDLEKVRSRLRS
ncbi:MAG: 3-deoxy-manno-octulosonate cytidylyltransferase [Calditrichaeota bacterium]|nr:3-deoxy-manno-octulosonate cytidylyltransferase [Calditrichota bacterium]